MNVKKKLKEFKESLADMSEQQQKQIKFEVVYRVRQKYIPRWMEMCNVTTPEEINYNDPRVMIEYYLCDPYLLLKVKSKDPAEKQAFYSLLSEEALDYYFNHPDEHGDRYCDIEKGKIKGMLGF